MTEPDVIQTFRNLHASGCFVIPNPWDRGSAIALASMGFRALATSSAALSFALGRPDSPGALDLDTTLANIREIVRATELPVSADFQDGYGATPADVEASVRRCVETGVAGVSIEDAAPDPDQPLYEATEALERVKAARAAIDATSPGVVLTARCEAFLVGCSDPMDVVLSRLAAFADAGADCLFAPGLRTAEQVEQVVRAVAPKPVNVLAVDPSWMTVGSLGDLGVRRISVGSALARTAWGAFLASAEDIASGGSFQSLARATPFARLDGLFAS
ncbi:MAG: 2-methylisocitrate lyase [Phycisphaerae bacterium]|nr:2-methylisocitrate lyase [Phycisphaerae bacterium]